jgi:hypothetical protein
LSRGRRPRRARRGRRRDAGWFRWLAGPGWALSRCGRGGRSRRCRGVLAGGPAAGAAAGRCGVGVASSVRRGRSGRSRPGGLSCTAGAGLRGAAPGVGAAVGESGRAGEVAAAGGRAEGATGASAGRVAGSAGRAGASGLAARAGASPRGAGAPGWAPRGARSSSAARPPPRRASVDDWLRRGRSSPTSPPRCRPGAPSGRALGPSAGAACARISFAGASAEAGERRAISGTAVPRNLVAFMPHRV